MSVEHPRSFELKIPSRLEQMNSVYELVGRAVQEYKLDEEMAYFVELSVCESAINAIRHGNQLDPNKEVVVKISSDGNQLEMVVEDEGDGFDLSDIPDPTQGDNLLKPSGRGILIIRSFMDELGLSRRPEGGSRLRMVKKIKHI